MDELDFLERIGTTRARIEAAAVGPSVVAITSALRTDGTALLTYALAKSLSAVGQSVVLGRDVGGPSLFDASGVAARNPNCTAPPYIRTGADGEPSVFELAPFYSRGAAHAAFTQLREHFAFAVLEAELPATNGSALSLCGAADFVLIAVEQGRAARGEDHALASVLRMAGANTLGVVTIARKQIHAFHSAPLPMRPARGRGVIIEEATRSRPLASRLG